MRQVQYIATVEKYRRRERRGAEIELLTWLRRADTGRNMKGLIAATVLIAGLACAEDAARTTFYKTQKGDTLSSIAKRFGMKPHDIAALNPHLNFRQLRVGQPIKLQSVPAQK